MGIVKIQFNYSQLIKHQMQNALSFRGVPMASMMPKMTNNQFLKFQVIHKIQKRDKIDAHSTSYDPKNTCTNGPWQQQVHVIYPERFFHWFSKTISHVIFKNIGCSRFGCGKRHQKMKCSNSLLSKSVKLHCIVQ